MDAPRPTVANAGDFDRERVIFRVPEDMNLNEFIIACCFRSDKGPGLKSGAIPATYWFGPKEVRKHDYVVIYTKDGVRREKTVEGGPTSHFYYWGKTQPIWTSDKKAVVVYASAWKTAEEQPIDDDDIPS